MRRAVSAALTSLLLATPTAYAGDTLPRATEAVTRLCEIFPNATPEQTRRHRRDAFDNAAVVFTGKAVELNRVTVRFEAREFWKGEPTKNVTLVTGLPPEPDIWVEDVFQFKQGIEYLVFAYRGQSGSLTTNACTRTALLSLSNEEILGLDEIAERKVVK